MIIKMETSNINIIHCQHIQWIILITILVTFSITNSENTIEKLRHSKYNSHEPRLKRGNNDDQSSVTIVPSLPRNDIKQPYKNIDGNVNPTGHYVLPQKRGPCTLYTRDPEVTANIKKLISNGAKLIKYDLKFDEYLDDDDPLKIVNASGSYLYKPNLWSRVTGEHGRKLLSLAFNYDVLSLQMLTFGVERLKLDIVDSPRNCFGGLNDESKIDLLRNLVINDFNSDSKEEIYLKEHEYVCNHIVEQTDGYGTFKYQCCSKRKLKVPGISENVQCDIEEPDKLIKLIYFLITALKFAFLLLGPLFLQKWIYDHSIRKTDYLVKLKAILRKTLLVHKVFVADESGPLEEPNRDFPGQFKKLKQILKVMPSDEVVPVIINRLHIQVNHRDLVTEKTIPVGVLQFIWEYFFQCGIINVEPFLSCCTESIIGSWATKFLFIKLMPRGSECNKTCRNFFSWAHVAYLIAGIILMAAIPTPFFIRLAIYYEYEEPEIELRKDCMKELGLKEGVHQNLLHYLTPTHSLLITLYVLYILTFLMLAFYHKYRRETFEDIVLGSLQDLRSISRLECIRLILSHIILPFEKFGLCIGMIVAALYWPFVIPLCVLTAAWYCIPTFYMTGRLLVQGRPWFIRKVRVPYVPKKKKQESPIDILSLGIISLENFMLLNNISPGPKPDDCLRRQLTAKSCKHELSKSFVGLLCTIWMFTVLIMYAECFGFLIEAFVLMLMGAIVNAGSAANYIMMGFWAITYSVSCYNDAYQKYLSLNAKIFEFIKDKLKDDIKVLTIFREERQRYTAFKYFSREELSQEKQLELEADYDSENELALVTGGTPDIQAPSPDTYTDTIEYINKKLHWKVHNLILFVDRKDVPRIPRRLFEMICEIEAPGCPGPVYKGLLKATQKFLYMVVFLLFVVIIVMSFGTMYQISSTNQLLVTLAGGFIPFVIRFVLDPSKGSIDLNTYTFEGKVHEIFRSYTESWPVHDVTFSLDSNVEQDITGTSGASAIPLSGMGSYPPSHVDLLFTIRDEDFNNPLYNIRSEPGSMPSIASGPGNRTSPDEQPFVTPNSPSNSNMIPMVALARGSTDEHRPESLQQNNPNQTPKSIVKDIVKSVARVTSQPASTLSQEELDLASNVELMVDLSRGGNPDVRSVNGSHKDNRSDEDSEILIDVSPTEKRNFSSRKDI